MISGTGYSKPRYWIHRIFAIGSKIVDFNISEIVTTKVHLLLKLGISFKSTKFHRRTNTKTLTFLPHYNSFVFSQFIFTCTAFTKNSVAMHF